MPHLTLEELARLVDEAPAESEALHLATCGECRAELEALCGQTAGLRRLPERTAPASQWPALQARLRAEGLVGGARASGAWHAPLRRAAAALALFVAGGAAGATLWPQPGGAAPGGPAVAAAPASTLSDAEVAVRSAEAAYLDALTRYAELSGAGQGTDPVNRLAALEGIVLTTRAALQEAPADPVINGYHLTALSQREAMLRQISAEDEWF